MFTIDQKTKKIRLHKGDTGTLTITATGHTYGADDRAVFTVRTRCGQEIIKRILPFTSNQVVIEFANADTDQLEAGLYYWDVRFVINPVYESNDIVDGTGIYTPGDKAFEFELIDVVGEI